ncbi:MAG: adenylate/guanylate cyclase domain-containing protein [Cyanobacteria bacterium J06627_28]
MRAFNRLSIQSKLMSMLLAVSIGSILVIAFEGYRSGRAAIKGSAEKRLIGLRASKARQIEDYFDGLRGQVEVLGSSPTILAAMTELSAGYKTVLGESKSIDNDRVGRLREFYRDEFGPRLSESSGRAINSDTFVPASIVSRYLQYEFIANSEFDIGEKDKLVDPGDGTKYSEFHVKYHPIFQQIVEEFDYYDLFLIDSEGEVVYSVFKEVDFATNLRIGPYARTSLANAYKDAQKQNQGYVSIADFSLYDPSYSAPAAFMATPIFNGTDLIGVMAIQIPVDQINSVMTDDGNWESDGLGQTGETFIVGDDFRMRSDSRVLLERPEEYFEALRARQVSERKIARIQNLNTSVLDQPADSDAVKRALEGETGIATITNYLGTESISAYAPLDIRGVDWVLLSEIERAEIFKPISDFTKRVMISAAGLVFVITLASLWLARKFLEPVTRLSEGFTRLSKGHKEVNVEVLADDELGQLAKSFNHMVKKNRKTSDLVFQKSQETEALLLNMFPASVAKRLKKGDVLIADEAESVTVGFVNLLGFQDLTKDLKPQKAIELLNEVVSALDDATDNHGVEKIKTTGSEYLAVSGLSVARLDHSKRIVDFAMDAMRIVSQINRTWDIHLEIRAGIHAGGVMAGTVGSQRLIYDVWGDTVVTAHYVQSAAQPGSVYVSQAVANSLVDIYEFEPKGEITARHSEQVSILKVKN